jgi:hypothetical protein
MTDQAHEGQILRYRTRQRIVHAIMATSFLVLLVTGLALVWSPLAFLAAGGWSRYLHRIAAVGFISVPILYILLDRRGAKEVLVESFQYDKDDVSSVVVNGGAQDDQFEVTYDDGGLGPDLDAPVDLQARGIAKVDFWLSDGRSCA